MKNARLTAEQREALQPYEEKYLRTWHEARWCRPLPPFLVDLMLRTWEAVTGSRRPFRNGCPTCERELMNDICTLYYAPADESPAKAAETPAEPAEASAPKKSPGEKEKGVKRQEIGAK